MEKWFLIIAAVLLILYFIFTETLDWVGRLEVIRQYFPKFPEFLERRLFRVIMLLVAIALLIRVATEHSGNKTEVSSVSTDAHNQAAPVPSPVPTAPPIASRPLPATVKVKPKPKPQVPVSVVEKPAATTEQPKQVPTQSCINFNNGICIEGENSGSATVVNNGPPPLFLNATWEAVAPAEKCTFTTEVTIVPNQAVSPPIEIAFDVDIPVSMVSARVKNINVGFGGGTYRIGLHPMDTILGNGIDPQHPALVTICTGMPIVSVRNPHVEGR